MYSWYCNIVRVLKIHKCYLGLGCLSGDMMIKSVPKCKKITKQTFICYCNTVKCSNDCKRNAFVGLHLCSPCCSINPQHSIPEAFLCSEALHFTTSVWTGETCVRPVGNNSVSFWRPVFSRSKKVVLSNRVCAQSSAAWSLVDPWAAGFQVYTMKKYCKK